MSQEMVAMSAQKLRMAENALVDKILMADTPSARRTALMESLAIYGDALLAHHRACEAAARRAEARLLVPISTKPTESLSLS